MKRMLSAALASSVLVLVAPAVASAHHGHHPRGLARTHKHHARSARLERFGVASVSGTPRAGFTVTQSSPENEPAGTIESFEGGVLKIKLGDGSIVSGKVTEDTELRCRSATPPGDDEDDQGDDDGGGSQGDEQGSSGGQFASQHGDFLAHAADSGDDEGDQNTEGCTTKALEPKTVVLEAELKLTGTGPVWEQIVIVH